MKVKVQNPDLPVGAYVCAFDGIEETQDQIGQMGLQIFLTTKVG